jgi:phosphatidylserine synthase
MVMMIVGSIADLISFGFAPMSLLAPIGAMTLVVNMLVAPCFKEKLTTRDIVFTIIIVMGTIICISFGSKEEHTYSIDTLIDLYQHAPFVVFSILLAVTMALLFFLINQSSQREAKFLHTQWDLKFQAVAYPAVAGTVAALSVLFAKSSAELVKETIKGNNQFNNFFAYILVAMLALCLFLQMKWLNIGLTKGDALFVLPVYQVFWVVMNVVAGMIYFEDFLVRLLLFKTL